MTRPAGQSCCRAESTAFTVCAAVGPHAKRHVRRLSRPEQCCHLVPQFLVEQGQQRAAILDIDLHHGRDEGAARLDPRGTR